MIKACQLRVFLAALLGLVLARWVAYELKWPETVGLAGLVVGWIAGNVMNATIFAERPCEPSLSGQGADVAKLP